MSDPVETPKRGWLKLLLFVSLAANLLIVGIIGGAFLSNRGNDGPPDRIARQVQSLIGAPFFRALPDGDRRELVRALDPKRDRLKENREALRGRFEAFLGALRTEPFDAAMVKKLLEEQRLVAVRRQDIGEDLLIERLEAMTPGARAEYADRLAKSLRHIRRK